MGYIWDQLKLFLLKLMELLYGLTSFALPDSLAWGLAIILMTIIVRILMHPLTQKQMVSMQRMQKIQPMIKVLQDKYGDDKEALNREMMALYKENKVNPASGCLPLIIQLPIFILLYSVLYGLTRGDFNYLDFWKNVDFNNITFLGINLGGSVLTTIANAIKLQDASGNLIPAEQLGIVMLLFSVFANITTSFPMLFANFEVICSWLPNLLLLILIGYLTWYQSHISSAGNSQMAMMTWFMPLFLTFICFSIPGGVLLYWGVSSLMGIIHQVRVMRKTRVEMSQKPVLLKEKPKKNS